MGFWDFIYSVGERVKGVKPDLLTVKHAGCSAYSYSSAAAATINQVVRVGGIKKLPK